MEEHGQEDVAIAAGAELGERRTPRYWATVALLTAGAAIIAGLLIGLTNPWRLIVIDQWLNHAIIGGLFLTAISVALCCMHLPNVSLRVGASVLVVLACGVWTLSWFGGYKNQPLHDPLARQRSPYNDVVAVVDHGGFMLDSNYIYLETDRGMASQRSDYVLGLGASCPRAPHLTFTAPDTLRVAADNGAEYSVTFDPDTLQARTTQKAGAETTCTR